MQDRSIHAILGSPDDVKFCSSMTLFAAVIEDNAVFRDAIARYYAGRVDQKTLDMLRGAT